MALTRRRKLNVAAGAAAFITAVLVAVIYVYTSLWPNITQGPRAGRPATLQAMPEAHLVYPGSHVVRTYTSRISRIGFSTVAYPELSITAAVDATPQAIFGYFTRELAARGWTGPASKDLHAPEAWHRGHYVLSMVFYDAFTAPDYKPVSGYTTTYNFGISYSSHSASPTQLRASVTPTPAISTGGPSPTSP